LNDRTGRPQRIGFCITELEPGGAERCLVELATRIDRQRFDPIVYCLGPRPAGNPTSLADVLEQSGVKVHYFGASRKLQIPSVYWKLRRQLVADSPRIIQSFLFHANFLGTIAARFAGVPHIITSIRVAERGSAWHLAVSRWTSRWIERHVCVSHAVRDFSYAQARLPRDELVVIPNGVDVARFSTAVPASLAEFGVKPGRRVMTYVGRIVEQKGVSWLVEQMPPILAKLPEYDLLLVGDGPQRAMLERVVGSLGLTERVHFAGFRRDVPEILAASDLYVHTSRWEGMPNAILEAMASGKAVVATDVEGVGEALGPGAIEQTVRPNDAEAFVGKVLALVSDPQLRTRLGHQNQERAAQVFGLEAMVGQYEALYASLLASGA
jgi:glycosyltransferase involved in cell wall biosynthesis